MGKTKIEWCDLTINPIVGCSKCSPGCDNCYAERFAARLAKNPKTAAKYAGVVDEAGKWTGNISCADFSVFKKLPKTSKRIFVGSMTDIFYTDAEPGSYSKSHLPRLFDVMASFPQHTFMLLTKRPENMRRWIDFTLEVCVDDILPSLWLGVTVCNQAEADVKIPVLLDSPAAKRFVSVEPMLEPVNLRRIITSDMAEGNFLDSLQGTVSIASLGGIRPKCASTIDWVICGGETGPNARPMHPDWVRSLRDQCQSAGVPFFFKGWGEWAAPCQAAYPDANGRFQSKRFADFHEVLLYGKKRAGRLLDGREWNEHPEAM